MKNSLHTSSIACCLFVISTIGITISAGEWNVFKTNRGTHASKPQPVFPLVQKKIQKVEGKVRFYNLVDNEFAGNHIVDADKAKKEWMVKHYDRMQVYSPWFDEHTEWYESGLVYKDMYAIYNCEDFNCSPQWIPITQFIFDEHPEWILRDSDGSPLYLPFGCNNGSCPQFAADISNSEFRQFWIDDLNERLVAAFNMTGKGYHGIFVDDVNLDLARSVVTGDGLSGNPINRATGLLIEDEAWQNYVAEFVELIRSEFLGKEIVHNSVWFHAQPGNPYLDRQIDAANTISLERGINDPNMQSGNGVFGIQSFLAFSHYIHSRARDTVHFVSVNDLPCPTPPCFAPSPLQTALIQIEYSLAGWLLASGGHDFFGSRELNTPDNWWHGFDTNLGKALGERYQDLENGLLRRDFKNGIVLLNGPNAAPVFMNLPETFYTLNGDPIDQVTLVSRVGKILLRNPPAIDSFVTP